MLVGNKKDLQVDEVVRRHLAESNQTEPVKTEDGRAMAKKIGAYAYVECSAVLNDGVREVFERVALATLPTKSFTNKVYTAVKSKVSLITDTFRKD